MEIWGLSKICSHLAFQPAKSHISLNCLPNEKTKKTLKNAFFEFKELVSFKNVFNATLKKKQNIPHWKASDDCHL